MEAFCWPKMLSLKVFKYYSLSLYEWEIHRSEDRKKTLQGERTEKSKGWESAGSAWEKFMGQHNLNFEESEKWRLNMTVWADNLVLQRFVY